MEDEPKSGTSINNPRPSELDTTTNLGILRVLEEQETCKSGALTQDGGNFSLTVNHTSSTGRTRRFLMFQDQRMLKDKQLSSGRDTVEQTRDGELSILTLIRETKPRDSTRNSVSTATDHSTLFLDFQ